MSHNVGGRLSSFGPSWQSITTDQFVLNVVHNGYALVFGDLSPPLSMSPLPLDRPSSHQAEEA